MKTRLISLISVESVLLFVRDKSTRILSIVDFQIYKA